MPLPNKSPPKAGHPTFGILTLTTLPPSCGIRDSLVRNRAISILAANARWDKDGKFDLLLDEFLSHVTDVKPITARQCVAALPEIAEAKPNLIPRIRAALEQADLSGYPDSMQPLVLKDIVAALQKMERFS